MYKDNSKAWLTVADVARYLNVSPEMVYKLVQRKDLPAIRIGSSWRISQTEFDHWVKLRQMEARPLIFSPLQQKVVQEFKRRLIEMYGDRFKGLYVFGSVARGDATTESDLDLLVLLRDGFNLWAERKKIIDLEYDVTYGQGNVILVSTLLASETDFLRRSNPLFERIREEGRLAA